MKKILYLTATNWWWAKQRPQFIAEGLSNFFDVTYVYPKIYRVSNIKKGKIPVNNKNLHLTKIFKLPFERYRIIKRINDLLFNLQIRNRINGFDIIWIAHPIIYRQLKSVIPGKIPLIYDCMDDLIEFPAIKRNSELASQAMKSEKELIDNAAHVFFSCAYLKNRISDRYKYVKSSSVVNNGISKERAYSNVPEPELVSIIEPYRDFVKLTYTGTISEWFDFELITESLRKFNNIIYIMAGPAEVRIPRDERIIYLGPLKHEKINGLLNISDALIMPFKDCELIRSVDPVKVYEYVSSGKPAIVLKYGETDKFKEYVYLYSEGEEYFELVRQISERHLKPKQNRDNCLAFASENNWEKRVEKIVSQLNEYQQQSQTSN
jgi:teichuronic acid biosynthesis glycosyltransferase TuaH